MEEGFEHQAIHGELTQDDATSVEVGAFESYMEGDLPEAAGSIRMDLGRSQKTSRGNSWSSGRPGLSRCFADTRSAWPASRSSHSIPESFISPVSFLRTALEKEWLRILIASSRVGPGEDQI